MSNKLKLSNKIKIAIIQNLTPGGAFELYKANIDYLKNKYDLKIIKEPSPNSNFISYLYFGLIYLPFIYYPKIIKNLEKDTRLILAYHSWVTKSPLFFFYSKVPILYICHEGMREFYDKEFQNHFKIKDKLINLIRYPISIMDKYNVKKASLILANSKFSKKIIDNYYAIKSEILYPGVSVKKVIERKKAKSRVNYTKFITIASIFSHKRLLFLIEVINLYKIRENLDSVSLEIIYNDYSEKYRREIISLSKKCKINLVLRYKISEKEKYLDLSLNDLFLYAPINEPFGLGVVEAAASRIPVVAYKFGGGYVEALENYCVLIDSLDLEVWVKAISSVSKMIRQKKSDYKIFNFHTINNMNKDLNKKIEKIIHARS